MNALTKQIIELFEEKKSSPTGNWTPVSRVTGGDTDHYTNEDDINISLLKG